MIYPSICVEIDQESKNNQIDANLWSYDSDWFNYSYNRLSYFKKKLENLLEMQFGLSLNLQLLPTVEALPVPGYRTLDHQIYRSIGIYSKYYAGPATLARIKTVLEQDKSEVAHKIYDSVSGIRSEKICKAVYQNLRWEQLKKLVKNKILDYRLTTTAFEYVKFAPDQLTAIKRTAEVSVLFALDVGHTVAAEDPTFFGSFVIGVMLAERLKSWEETITRDKTRLLIIENVIGGKFPIDADTILKSVTPLVLLYDWDKLFNYWYSEFFDVTTRSCSKVLKRMRKQNFNEADLCCLMKNRSSKFLISTSRFLSKTELDEVKMLDLELRKAVKKNQRQINRISKEFKLKDFKLTLAISGGFISLKQNSFASKTIEASVIRVIGWVATIQLVWLINFGPIHPVHKIEKPSDLKSELLLVENTSTRNSESKNSEPGSKEINLRVGNQILVSRISSGHKITKRNDKLDARNIPLSHRTKKFTDLTNSEFDQFDEIQHIKNVEENQKFKIKVKIE